VQTHLSGEIRNNFSSLLQLNTKKRIRKRLCDNTFYSVVIIGSFFTHSAGQSYQSSIQFTSPIRIFIGVNIPSALLRGNTTERVVGGRLDNQHKSHGAAPAIPRLLAAGMTEEGGLFYFLEIISVEIRPVSDGNSLFQNGRIVACALFIPGYALITVFSAPLYFPTKSCFRASVSTSHVRVV